MKTIELVENTNPLVEAELAFLAVLQVLIENRNATNAAIESVQSFLRSLRH